MQSARKAEPSIINRDQGSTVPNARGEKIIVKRKILYGILVMDSGPLLTACEIRPGGFFSLDIRSNDS